MSLAPDASGDAMRAEIGALLAETGPRPSCSEAEHQLGRLLAARWGAFADDVATERFRCHPHAFLGFIPFVCVATLLGVGLLVAGHPLAAALLGVPAAVVTIAELLLYIELVDRLFPEREGANVVARIRPRGPIKQRILLTAHQDSAWEFNVWWWFKQAGPIVNIAGLGACLIPAILGTLGAMDVVGETGVWIAGIVGLVLAPATLANAFFHTFRAVPGAMDDLAGLVSIEAAGTALAADRLAHTEVVLVACSSEECGLRGAKRYAAAHAHAHAAVPTIDINVDGIYDEGHFQAITHEVTMGVRHDRDLIARAERLAAARGRTLQHGIIPFGATDGAAFAQAGVRTIALLAQDTRSLAPNYHTRLDTLDHVRPRSLEWMRDLVVDLVRELDAEVA